jgi:hypothetical protein
MVRRGEDAVVAVAEFVPEDDRVPVAVDACGNRMV